MSLYGAVYVYLDFICVLILAIILYRMHKSSYLSAVDQSFSHVIIQLVIIIVLDVCAVIASGTIYILSVITNATFLTWSGVVGYSWLRYTGSELKNPERSRAVRIALAVPTMVLALLCYASIWTGWVFWVDPSTILYHRGPFHFMQILLSSLYLVASVVCIARAMKSCSTVQRRRELRTMLTFSILPCVGAVLSIVVYGIPLIWTLCTVAVFMVFVNFQDYSISMDGLTGLNNRRSFESRAEALVRDHEEEGPVFLLLMDVDSFKSINDTYGHRTGDAALVEVASLLKRVVGDQRLFVSRYGGDEFAIMGTFEDRAAAEALKSAIVSEFEHRNRTSETPYSLMLSIGIAQVDTESAQTVDELVAAADALLYAEKTLHRAAAYAGGSQAVASSSMGRSSNIAESGMD